MRSSRFDKCQIIFLLMNILVYVLDLSYANNQRIQIYSKYQLINSLDNTIFFKENVILKYERIELFANKIVIAHDQNTRSLSMIKAYGDPVVLKHNPESNSIVSAQSSIIYYNIADNIITLNGNAYIEQLGNSVRSDSIVYFINQKKIQAISKKDNKTVTILRINPI